MADVVKLTVKPTFRNLAGRFAKAERGLLDDRREMVRKLGRRFVSLARDEAPKKTGAFARQIRFRTFTTGQKVGFRVNSPQPLGTYIIEGTRAHTIQSRGKFLRFSWDGGPRGAGVYFFRSVRHPGTDPNPYHQRAYRRWLPKARSELKRISTRYVKVLQ